MSSLLSTLQPGTRLRLVRDPREIWEYRGPRSGGLAHDIAWIDPATGLVGVDDDGEDLLGMTWDQLVEVAP